MSRCIDTGVTPWQIQCGSFSLSARIPPLGDKTRPGSSSETPGPLLCDWGAVSSEQKLSDSMQRHVETPRGIQRDSSRRSDLSVPPIRKVNATRLNCRLSANSESPQLRILGRREGAHGTALSSECSKEGACFPWRVRITRGPGDTIGFLMMPSEQFTRQGFEMHKNEIDEKELALPWFAPPRREHPRPLKPRFAHVFAMCWFDVFSSSL